MDSSKQGTVPKIFGVGSRALRQSGLPCVGRSGLPRVATIGVFRGLRRGVPCVGRSGYPRVATRWLLHVATRGFRSLRQNVKIVGEGMASAKCLFRHNPFFSPSSSSFAIIVFRHHCVSQSSSFAIIVFRRHQVSQSSSSFVKFTWNLKGHSRYLQGTSRVQVEPNCVHLDPNLELTT